MAALFAGGDSKGRRAAGAGSQDSIDDRAGWGQGQRKVQACAHGADAQVPPCPVSKSTRREPERRSGAETAG